MQVKIDHIGEDYAYIEYHDGLNAETKTYTVTLEECKVIELLMASIERVVKSDTMR